MLARPRDRLSDWGAVFVRFVRSFGCGFALLVIGRLPSWALLLLSVGYALAAG